MAYMAAAAAAAVREPAASYYVHGPGQLRDSISIPASAYSWAILQESRAAATCAGTGHDDDYSSLAACRSIFVDDSDKVGAASEIISSVFDCSASRPSSASLQQQQLAGSMTSSSCSASELLPPGSTTQIRGDWNQLLGAGDSSCCNRVRNPTNFSSTVLSSAQVLNSVVDGIEGFGAQGQYCSTSRLGGAIDSLTVAAGEGGTGRSSRSRWSEELEQQPCGGISVEPATKGGLVTLQQLAGVVEGVATCSSDSHYHCLDQFSSDPAFAERAAKFSSFSNNNNVDDGGTTSYSQMINSHHPLAALPFRQTTSDCIIGKSRDQRVAAGTSSAQLRTQPLLHSGRKISRTSSCPPAAAAAVVAPKLGTAANDATHEAEPRSGHTQNMEVEELVAASAAVDQPELVKEPAALEASPQGFMRSKEVGIDGVTRSEAAAADFSCCTPAATAAAEVGRSSARESSDDTTRENKRKFVDIHSNGKETNLKENEKPSCILMQTSEPPCTTSSAAAAAAAAAASHKKVDYVHVRARRGQATDSHSLAERVRREKISERMKYLQELVPGCSKVTGKALMLDEIINYVQSLRRQVEFLSMKLASVNSQLDFNLDSILNKELLWSQDSAVLLPEPSLSFGLHLPPLIQQHLATEGPDFRSLATFDTLLCRRTMSAPISVPCAPNADAFGDDPSTRMSTEWDGELQTMFQMGFGQVSRATPLMEGSFNTCQLPAGHMKVEL
ncbi:unnamed protein product [Sphagnum tenellum]